MTLPILTLDFETYFDDDYTLKKMTTEEYVRDPRFEALGVGIRWTSAPVPEKPGMQPSPQYQWYMHEEFKYIAQFQDWSNIAILCHHAHFDGLILSHHYGIKPRFIYDTLSMARLQLGNHVSVSLQSLADHYGLQAKNVPYNLFKGKHWADLGMDVRRALADGCLHDVGLTWDIFNRLAVGFPAEEYQVIDLTVRMFTEPQLVGDVNELAAVWTHEQKRKAALLAELAVTPGDLQSAANFVALLEREGVEVETKPGKNGPIPCIAKTDDFMQALLEDDNERVRTLAEARLGVRSTLDQTRSERLGFMATRGAMPVYLSYCGAHTTRWSGGDRVNWQNFKRGSAIRRAVKAPPGHRIVKADKSQIECVAHGELVLTDKGPKPIQDVELHDLVWDGLEWVKHEGVVCRGTKAVISYQGLTATPDHVVFTRRGAGQETVALSFAAAHSVDLLAADTTLAIRKAPMREPGLSRLEALWRQRYKVQIQKHERCCVVGDGTSSTLNIQEPGDRSQEEQRALRAEEPEAVHSTRECQQPLDHVLGTHEGAQTGDAGLQAEIPELWLWTRPNSFVGSAWAYGRADYQEIQARSLENERAIREETTREVPVYDIVNAGPRYRFAVSGVIVSNCRILNYVAGQWDVIERFAAGHDPYLPIASQFYGREITRADPAERGVGKQLELSCGYGAGGSTIVRTAKRGTYGPPVHLSQTDGVAARDLYRSTHPNVVNYWKTASRMISALAGTNQPIAWGPLTVETGVIHCQGIPIWYPELNYYRDEETGEDYWRYKTRKGWAKLYGGKLTENVVQFMSAVDMRGSILRILARTGFKPKHLEHDSALWVIPERLVAPFEKVVRVEMTRAPTWLPDIPLDCEVTVGETM